MLERTKISHDLLIVWRSGTTCFSVCFPRFRPSRIFSSLEFHLSSFYSLYYLKRILRVSYCVAITHLDAARNCGASLLSICFSMIILCNLARYNYSYTTFRLFIQPCHRASKGKQVVIEKTVCGNDGRNNCPNARVRVTDADRMFQYPKLRSSKIRSLSCE